MSGVLLSAAVAPTPPLQPERPHPQLQRQLLVQAQDPREEGKGCGLPFLWCKLVLLFRRSMHRAMVLLLLRASVFLGRSLAHLVVKIILRIFTPVCRYRGHLCVSNLGLAFRQPGNSRCVWECIRKGHVKDTFAS